MDDQRVPSLDEMDEQEASEFLTELVSNLGAESGYELRHEDFVMEMPQSGERIRGRNSHRPLWSTTFTMHAPGGRA
jgi:hypothetical protein